MNTLVVLFALASVACGSLVPIAQPPHHPAIVLDPHGRPLDTAEVINARAVHLQAKALEGHYAPLAHAAVVAPVAHSVYASPLLAHSAYGYGHLLKKRSLGHLAYAAPIIAPSAVSHQSRLDVISSPAVVSHAVATPVYAHAAPVVAAVAPAAVSHQSRVDIRTSPAIVSHAVAAPVLAHAAYSPLAHTAYASPLWAHSAFGLSHGHLLKKRSLGHLAYAAPVYAHAAPVVAVAPAAVSHQSRVDVHSSPAIVSHAAYAPLAHSVYAAPLAHSSIWSSPLSHLAHASLW